MNANILLLGKNTAAIQAARGLLDSGWQSENIHCGFFSSEVVHQELFGNFPKFCSDMKLPSIDLDHFQRKEIFEVIRTYMADHNVNLCISVQFSAIIPPSFVQENYGRILNCHFSLLPSYRGVAPIPLAILNGEDYFGITLHLIDSGIDTGPILDQIKFLLSDLTNFECYKECENQVYHLFTKNKNLLLNNRENAEYFLQQATSQKHETANYYAKGEFDYTNTLINPNKSASQVIRQFRALFFPPILYPRLRKKGDELKRVLSWEPQFNSLCIDKKPGTLIEKSNNKYVLITRDCPITIQTMAEEDK